MKKGYSFDGFLYQDKIYKESLTVKENITLVAKYTKLPVYNIIFKNEIGDIIKTTSAYVGEEFTDLFEYDSDEPDDKSYNSALKTIVEALLAALSTLKGILLVYCHTELVAS